MKYFTLIFIICFVTKSFSQNDMIDKHLKLPEEIRCNRNVKEISIEYSKITKDTIKSAINVKYSKNKIKTIKFISNYEGEFIKKVEIDKLGRLSKISNIIKGKRKVFMKPFFYKTKTLPDSVIVYGNNGLIEKYLNTIKDNQIIKQNHFNNNVLVDYKQFSYDDVGRLIAESHIYPENINDELLIRDQSDKYSMTFYPLNKIEYEYSKIEDTLVSVIYKNQIDKKEVIKEFKNGFIDLKIISNYKNNELVSINEVYKVKDSVSDTRVYFKGGIKYRYYNTFKNNDGFITKWTSHTNDKESIYKVKYVNFYDEKQNWIKREIIINDRLTEIIIRRIKY